MLDFSTTPSRCAHLLALSLDKTVDLNNANTPWKPDAECPVHTLARHDIAAAWDFAEAFPLGETSGSFFSAYERTADAIGPSYCKSTHTATIQVADACSHPLPHSSAAVWFTDPPYYDSVPYAHLSDFFYIWLRRTPSYMSRCNQFLDSEVRRMCCRPPTQSNPRSQNRRPV